MPKMLLPTISPPVNLAAEPNPLTNIHYRGLRMKWETEHDGALLHAAFLEFLTDYER